MRVLLDEYPPRKLKLELTGHDAKTVPEMGWTGDAFITVGRNLPAQQRVDQLPFGVVVLGAPRNDIDTLRPLLARVRAALEQIRPGDVVRIEF